MSPHQELPDGLPISTDDAVDNIWVAASNGNVALVQSLLQHDPALINAQDDHGYSPLHAATAYAHHDLLEFLLQHPDINVNIQDEDGDAPLHLAEDLASVQLLLAHNANPLLANCAGLRPAETAYREDHEDVSRFLQDLAPDTFSEENVAQAIHDDDLTHLHQLMAQHDGLQGLDDEELRAILSEAIDKELVSTLGNASDPLNPENLEYSDQEDSPNTHP